MPDRETLNGKRDYALLRLLWDNALRRCEAVGCDIADLDLDGRKLAIAGKGRNGHKEQREHYATVAFHFNLDYPAQKGGL